MVSLVVVSCFILKDAVLCVLLCVRVLDDSVPLYLLLFYYNVCSAIFTSTKTVVRSCIFIIFL